MKRGLLLINLGTPDSARVSDVRKYLKEFLSDPRVIDIPAIGRWLLVNLVIGPFRSPKSAAAYRQVWGNDGSPLLVETQNFTNRLRDKLRGSFAVVGFAMRYQSPSIHQVLNKMQVESLDELVVLPLFPQYSSAATGSAIEALYREIGGRWNAPALRVLPAFYADQGFLNSFAAVCKNATQGKDIDRLLFSFHGLPVRHCTKSHPNWCYQSKNCCDAMGESNNFCYRAQCFATARGIAKSMQLREDQWEVCFQSRLGRTEWIKPYTDIRLQELAAEGVKRIAVCCPSFVADCLETLEEIDIRARQQFIADGGEELIFVPSLNSETEWVEAVSEMVRV